VLFAHNEVVIKAPCATVWQHLIEAQNWPAWYPNAQDVKIANNQSGALQQNSIFEWSTFGLPMTSIVYEYVPNSRLPGLEKAKVWTPFFTTPGIWSQPRMVAR
jgi:Polyketide cyclase / dehydrase and lipid transport